MIKVEINEIPKSKRAKYKKELFIAESERYFHRDKNGEPYWYEFTIDSTHFYTSKVLFILAIQLIINQLELFSKDIPKISSGEDTFMQFSLPSKFNSTNTPLPNENSVEISYIDAGYFAVFRYSGRTTDKNFYKHVNTLFKELEKKSIIIKSPPIKAIYDGPFTIPLFRRNEVIFLVEWN